MDARARKLAIKLRDRELAQKLVDAGFDTPAKIKRASDKDIRAIPGVGDKTLKGIRERCPKLAS